MRYKGLCRVLALDLHPRRFGYAVVEGPDRLLDWGVRSYRGKDKPKNVLVQKRLRPILKLWNPKFLVIRGARRVPSKRRLVRGRLLEGVTAEAKKHRIPVRKLSDNVETLTKDENARRVAEHFPTLWWDLPGRRKPWESEDYRMGIFAAAGLALTYFDVPAASTPAIPRTSPASFAPRLV
jgi:hypothetical protein